MSMLGAIDPNGKLVNLRCDANGRLLLSGVVPDGVVTVGEGPGAQYPSIAAAIARAEASYPSLGSTRADFSAIYPSSGDSFTLTVYDAEGVPTAHIFEYGTNVVAGSTTIANVAGDFTDLTNGIAAHIASVVASSYAATDDSVVVEYGWMTIALPEGWVVPLHGEFRRKDTDPDIVLVVYPGTYAPGAILHNRMHAVFLPGAEIAVTAGGPGITLGARHSSVVGAMVNAESAINEPVGVALSADAPSYRCEIKGLRGSVRGWSVRGGAGYVNQCVLQDMSGECHQPIWITALCRDSIISDVHYAVPADWTISGCHSLCDLSAGLINCSLSNMSFKSRATGAGYGFMLSGVGNVMSDVVVESVTPNAPYLFAVVGNDLGEAIVSPNLLRNVLIRSVGTLATPKIQVDATASAEVQAIFDNVAVECTKSDATIELELTTAGMLLLRSPILSKQAVTLKNGSQIPIGQPTGSGAGLSAALLDASFANDSAANRPLLAGWFRGKYVNTSDSNKVYTAWTDGTTWYSALQAAAA